MVLPCLIITVLLNHLPIRLPWNANNCFLAAALMAAGYGIRQKDLLERQWQHKWLEPIVYAAAAAIVLALGIWNDAMSTSMLMSAYGPHGDWGVLIYFIGGILGPVSYTHLDVYKRQVRGPRRPSGPCPRSW